MENTNTRKTNQDDKKFTIALIAFVMWVFATGIMAVYSLLVLSFLPLFIWLAVSLLLFRTINVLFFKIEFTELNWMKNYSISSLAKSPFEAIL